MRNYFSIDWKVFRELVITATPVMISQGAFAIMVFTDRYFMSLVSPTHVAASLGGGVASFFCLSFFMGVLSYSNAIVAQYYGAGKLEKCSKVLTQSVLLSIISAPILLLIGWGVGHIFAAMNHDPLQEELERSYFNIMIMGAVVTLFKLSMASYFSGVGRTPVVMIADMLGVLVNVPLTYALIFGYAGLPEMGIVGAGVGTIIATGFSILIFALFYFHQQNRKKFKVLQSFVIEPRIIKKYLKSGLPSGVEMFLNVAAFNLFILMFQSYGIEEGASVTIVLNWDILSYVPMLGINIALISLVGRAIGSGDMNKTNKLISAGFFMALSYSGVLALRFVVFRETLVDVFIQPGEQYSAIHSLSSNMMIGLASYAMADAVILVAGGVLRGAGDTRWLMKASVLLHWAMLLIQYIVISVLGYGPEVSWAVFVCMILSIAVTYLIRVMSNKWSSQADLSDVIDSEPNLSLARSEAG